MLWEENKGFLNRDSERSRSDGVSLGQRGSRPKDRVREEASRVAGSALLVTACQSSHGCPPLGVGLSGDNEQWDRMLSIENEQSSQGERQLLIQGDELHL